MKFMDSKEVIEKWEGYLDLVKRAEAFLSKDVYFDFLFVDTRNKFILIYYSFVCEGETNSECQHVPLDYFCRGAVKEFFVVKKQQEDRERQLEIKAEKENEEQERKILAHLIRKYGVEHCPQGLASMPKGEQTLI